MGKILVEVDEIILGAIHSTYQLVLKEVNGNRRLPIIIGVPEAQSIALAIEGKTLKRPNTHDLFLSMSSKLAFTMKETFINRFEDGVFYAEIILEHNGTFHTLDSRTSDGVALAIRFNAPIFVEDRVLAETGVDIQKKDFDTPERAEETFEPPRIQTFKEELTFLSLNELEKLLQEALDMEDYFRAATIRDEIAKRK
ncbi:MAG: bifunctional nuclease family protein [Bacteroidia bacterium]|jgi:bifunctional DNase/RNase|nr:bifunctional nuclease family protein [Bacteroidia bacterium]MCO5252749.1 bifunctional nuclease family protein [Bacteroidota bacterium]MCZ2130096.1 bifunctional nuclease family protein [Bacteroidia bacterium]